MKTTRRSFLKKTIRTGAGMGALSGFAIGQVGQPAHNRVNLALIGVGGHGYVGLQNCTDENLVAFCDVDEQRAAPAYQEHPQVPRYRDFRKMFDQLDKQIDAVLIATPNHTHFPIAMEAMLRGKHVYLQKPLAHTLWETRSLQETAHKTGIIHQMGNQGHATDGIRLVVEWFRSGVLGDVTEVHAWTNRESGWKQSYPPQTAPIPKTLDWDLWLGPKPERPYSPAYLPSAWRYWWDFGNGALGDLAPHTLDAPVWALELGAPISVEAKVEGPSKHIAPKGAVVQYEFPKRGSLPPVTLTWYEPPHVPAAPKELWPGMELRPEGMMLVGTKGILYTPGWNAESPGVLLPKPLWEDFKKNPPSQSIPRVPGGPYSEWLRAIKGQGPKPAGNFDIGGPLTETILLGTIAMQTGKRIEWDTKAMSITNHPDLNNLIKLPTRKGWEYSYQS